MRPEHLELQLKRRTIRRLPEEWRAEILSAAFAARADSASDARNAGHWMTSKKVHWSALAAVWALIAVIHFLSGENEPSPRVIGVSIAWMEQLREQRLMLVETAEPQPAFVLPRATPRPKSSARGEPNFSNQPASCALSFS